MTARKIVRIMNRPAAQKRIRELAEDSANVNQVPEIKRRMRERKVTWREVLHVLRAGHIVDGPARDMHGCWRCELELFRAGRRVTVVVSICDDAYLVAITTWA